MADRTPQKTAKSEEEVPKSEKENKKTPKSERPSSLHSVEEKKKILEEAMRRVQSEEHHKDFPPQRPDEDHNAHMREMARELLLRGTVDLITGNFAIDEDGNII